MWHFVGVQGEVAHAGEVGIQAGVLRSGLGHQAAVVLRLSEDGHGLRATVHDAEYLGHETLLYARLDGLDPAVPPLVARLAGLRPFHRGDPLYLMADAAQWHLFDTDGWALHAPEEQGDA